MYFFFIFLVKFFFSLDFGLEDVFVRKFFSFVVLVLDAFAVVVFVRGFGWRLYLFFFGFAYCGSKFGCFFSFLFVVIYFYVVDIEKIINKWWLINKNVNYEVEC